MRYYGFSDARGDAIAGCLIATLLVPQAAAYAFLAELPASAGFFAAAFAPLGYLLFATSRHVSVGPVALVSLLTASSIATLGRESGSGLDVAILIALVVGLVLVIVGFLRLGYLTNFISEPVLTGFIAGAALVIGMTQVGHFLGIEADRGGTFIQMVQSVMANAEDTNRWALVLGGLTLGGILIAPPVMETLARRLNLRQETANALANASILGVLGVAVAATYYWRIPVDTVGKLAVEVPVPQLPALARWAEVKRVLPDAVAIAVLAYVMAYGTAATLAGQRRQTIDRDHEAGALGLGNIASATMGGYAVGASLSRSALGATLNARSPLAPALAGLLTLGVGLASVGVFQFVAKAVLAALILKAVLGMIDLRAMWRYMRISKSDAAGVMVTLTTVLALGVRWGIAIGALTSLATYLYQTSRPRIVVEGVTEDDGPMRDVERRDTQRVDRNVLVMRMDDDLYFGSASYFEDSVSKAVADHPHIDHLVVDCKSIGLVDATAIETLRRLNNNLRAAGVALHLAHACKPVEVQLRHAGLVSELQDQRIFATARDAADSLGEP